MYSFTKGFTSFPTQSSPRTYSPPPCPSSKYTSSNTTSTPSTTILHNEVSKNQRALIPKLTTTIETLTSRISQLEETIRTHTSISEEQIITLTRNQQIIYDKLSSHIDSVSNTQIITTPTDPTLTNYPLNVASVPHDPQPSQLPSSTATNDANPNLPPPAIWPSTSSTQPIAPLQATPMDPQFAFQTLYVLIKKRLTSAHTRQQLRDIGLPSRLAVDVHHPASHILSITVRSKHFAQCQEALHDANLTTVPTFDPLDPTHLINPVEYIHYSICIRLVYLVA
ncbi:hypothetical protein MAM1_1161d11488 [Mucor ambiguus]|uniref:Uncharacterized protein n=1 Tax=Mucor ambiguus TaxID=91626 RepID=A0A0C9MWW7_9FUNG|nr:hypothetical protein MAM1_1161d11488 [Mucor ambiguus]